MNIIKFIILVLIFINISFVNYGKCDAESKALDIIDRYRDIARYTFFTTDGKLEKYPEGFCGGTPIEDCDWAKYIEAIILLSAITLIIAAITLIFGIFFWVFRYCFFGGCQPTHGMCCPRTKLDNDIGEGYSTKQVLILKLVVLVCVAGCVAVFITALKGNSTTTTNVNNLGYVVFNKTSDTLTRLQEISDQLNATSFRQFDGKEQIQTQLIDLIVEGEKLESQGEDINKNVKDVNSIRQKIIVIGLVFCFVAAATIGVSALFGLPMLAKSGALSLILFIPFMWIVFSVHYPINSVIADVCTSYNSTGISQFSNFSNPIIDEIFEGCQVDNNTISVFKGLESLVWDLFNNGTNTTCSKISDACSLQFDRWQNDDQSQIPYKQNVLDCQPSLVCSNDTIGIYLYSSTVHDFNFKCRNNPTCGAVDTCNPTDPNQMMTCGWTDVPSVNNCATQCQNPQLVTISTEMVDVYQLVLTLSSIWFNQVTPIIKCSFLNPFIMDIQDIVCVDEVVSLDLLIAPTAIFAILMSILGICAVLGSKRFNSHFRIKSSKKFKDNS